MKSFVRRIVQNAQRAFQNAALVRGTIVWCSVARRLNELPLRLRYRFVVASVANGLFTVLAVLNLLPTGVQVPGFTFNPLYALAAVLVLIDTTMWLAMAPKAYLAVLRQNTARRWWGLA